MSAHNSRSNANNRLPIRAWLGYRRNDIAQQEFLNKLGLVFMPGTIYTGNNRLHSLAGYSPAVMPSHFDDRRYPDEVALVFYKSIEEYIKTMATLEGLEYQVLHGAIFDLSPGRSSTKDFPQLLTNNLSLDTTPYYVYSNGNNWQSMTTRVLIATRKSNTLVSKMAQDLYVVLNRLQRQKPSGEGALIVRASSDCVVAWQLGDPRVNGDHLYKLTILKALDCVYEAEATATSIPADLNTAGTWLTVKSGDFFSFQFPLS